ncbi:MAG: hypothetical protein V4722_20150 [Bacteroidota bacterium]
MRRLIPTLALGLGSCLASQAQLYIDNATFFIETGATVTVQGDLTSNVSIQGPGKILLKGSALQNVNMNNGGAATNAYTIPNLEIDNAANVALTGNTKVGTNLTFTTGKIQAGNFNFVLANLATVTTPGAGKFIETNGTGFAQREAPSLATASNLSLPVGVGSSYTPITLSHAGGTYGATSLVGAQAKLAKSPNAHIRTESYTNAYWPVASTNITGGTLTGVGTYNDPGFTGTETDIRGMSFNGTDWTLTGVSGQDVTLNTVTGALTTATGQIFGMNRFLLMNSRALLQGASPTAGVMLDGLRTGTSVIPLTEPYRGAPYNFTSVNGGAQEVAAAGVFADLGNNNNIVDWVFVELRNAVTSGATVQETRSALIQRDGDIVDMDGTSPLYFKNLDAGNFTVTIRHRNHLAISTNSTGAIYKNLTLSASTPLLDFSTTGAANILGAANSNYANVGGFNMMWAGNANFSANVRYSGINNDKDHLLGTVLSGNQALILNPIYSSGDMNMNKTVRYSGISNDKDFLLSTPLGANQATIRLQVLPN